MIRVTISVKQLIGTDGYTAQLKTVETEYTFKTLAEACEELVLSMNTIRRTKKRAGGIFPFNYFNYKFEKVRG